MINHNINTIYLDLMNDYDDVLMSDDPQQEHLDVIVDLLKHNFSQFYESSKRNNYYWHFCSYRTYINTFDERLNHYLNIHDDEGNNEIDFINSELKYIHYLIKSETITFVDESSIEKIKKETRKKITFLRSKLPENGNTRISNSIEIFTSRKAKELFQRYLEETEEDTNVLAKISFIYRVMFRDKLINEYIRPEIFKKEISKNPYNIDIEHSLKSLEKVSSVTKLNFYKSLKQIILKTVE